LWRLQAGNRQAAARRGRAGFAARMSLRQSGS
jgi:hypothetical protein